MSSRLEERRTSAVITMSIHRNEDGFEATSDSEYTKGDEYTKSAIEATADSFRSESVRLGKSDGGAWATGGNIEVYKPIPEYEGAHRYDPLFEWDPKEERKLVRKVSLISPYRTCSTATARFTNKRLPI